MCTCVENFKDICLIYLVFHILRAGFNSLIALNIQKIQKFLLVMVAVFVSSNYLQNCLIFMVFNLLNTSLTTFTFHQDLEEYSGHGDHFQSHIKTLLH